MEELPDDEPWTPINEWEENPSLRCDACFRRATHVVEVPRHRGRPKSKLARFRLCLSHMLNLTVADEAARAHHIGGDNCE